MLKPDGEIITSSLNPHLIDVIAQIERWYGVEIRLHHKQIAQDLLSGSFRNESIQNVIRSLSIQYGFKYEIHKDIITIY